MLGRRRVNKTNYWLTAGAGQLSRLFYFMHLYVTEIIALSPVTGEMTVWAGPVVPGISFADAQAYCESRGLGYCRVIGKLVAEIPCFPGTIEPDFSKKIDYDNLN